MSSKKPNKTSRHGDDNKNTVRSGITVYARKPAVPSKTSSVYVSSDVASDSLVDPPGASSSITKSSDFKIYCDPCSTAGDFEQAVGYCSDCKEYYCQSCYRGHSRSKATRNHTLMDQSTMPTISITPPSASLATMNINKQSKTDDSQFQDEFHFVRDINIKHPHEKNDCFITGMTVISDNELVIIDHGNKSVKMLNVDQNIMNGILFFDTVPVSITTIPNREVAVTFHHQLLIRIISTTGTLSILRSIKLSGLCAAVVYVNDKFYMSYSKPVKFQILSLSGGVRKTIQPDAQVLQQCTEPHYIAIHPDESRMYVSDGRNDVVLCMDMHGTMLAVYKDVGLERPEAILFTPFNSIYLCNQDQDIIYKIADDLSEASVVLGAQDGLVGPIAMCFCPGRKYLYISNGVKDPKFCDVIKQFKYS